MTTPTGAWTDPYGVERNYSQDWAVTRPPGGSPEVSFATTLEDVNVVPRAALSGSTFRGSGCRRIKLHWSPITAAIVKAEVFAGSASAGTFDLNAASGAATLDAADPAWQGHYNGCDAASGSKPGHYLVRLVAPNVALPTDWASVQVGQLPLLEGSAIINSGATVRGGVRSATVRWKALTPPSPEPRLLILTATPVSDSAPTVRIYPDYTASSARFANLVPGVTYQVTMTGTNAIGTASVVFSGRANVVGPPGPVLGLKAKRDGKGVTLDVGAPESYGSPVTAYKITGSKKAQHPRDDVRLQ